jgi:hypothetical protein
MGWLWLGEGGNFHCVAKLALSGGGRQPHAHGRLLHVFAGLVDVGVHDVVRRDEADDEKPRLPFRVQLMGVGPEPADGVAAGVDVGVVALIRRADLVAVGREGVETELAQRVGIIDVGLGRDNAAAELELAEIGGGIAEVLEDRAHARLVGVETWHVTELHLVEHAVHLRRLAREHHPARRRAHRRADIVIVEGGAALYELLPRRRRITRRRADVIGLLVGDEEHDVVRPAERRAAARRVGLCRRARAGRSRRRGTGRFCSSLFRQGAESGSARGADQNFSTTEVGSFWPSA